VTDPAALPTFGLPAWSGPAAPDPTAPDPTTQNPVRPASAHPDPGTRQPGAPLPDGSQQEAPLRDRVLAALLDAGYPAQLDADGDVEVAVQGQKLFVRCVDSVPPLMRVFGQWLMNDLPADELTRLRAANAVTSAVNLAKATVHEDRLVVAVDLLAGDEFHLPSLLHASMDAVLGCVRSWYATVLDLMA
jgi:hypothetical protein